MINWSQTLIREIARRRCVLFLGAGVSASAVNSDGNRPLGWEDFLSEASDLLPDADAKAVVKKLIEHKKYLLALQAIADDADTGDYQSLLERNYNNASFQPSKLHEVIMKLDSQIVITTNFDKIYESYCQGISTEGFRVISYHSSDLGDALRNDTRMIVKAHGSIDEPSKMVFTKSEYHKVRNANHEFYQILRAIFLTHTCIFIGCGLEDPDILLTLEDVKITSSSSRPHYALILKDEHSTYSVRDWRSSYNIEALEYEPDHSALVTDLEELLAAVESFRAASS